MYGPYEVGPTFDAAPAPAPAPETIEAVRPASAKVIRDVGGLQQPALVRVAPRRLPPVDGDVETVAASEEDLQGGVAPAAKPMRVDYESRYRATGGVYPSQQRAQEERAEEEAAAAEDRSWWDRVLRRGS